VDRIHARTELATNPGIHGDNDVYIMRADGTDLRRIAAPRKSGGFNVAWGR
jgi:hypothetical protein